MTSAGGPASRYAAGTVISVPRIVGHGTLGLTECPGATLTPQVALIRAAVQKRLKARNPKKKGKKKRSGAIKGPSA